MIPRKIYRLLEQKAAHLSVQLKNLDTAMQLDLDTLLVNPSSQEHVDNLCDTIEVMHEKVCSLQAIVHTLRWMEKGEEK